MDIFIMQQNFGNEYLVVIGGDVYVCKYETCKIDKPFFSFKPKHIFIGKSKVCEMTELSGAVDNSSDFDGNTFLLENEGRKYVYISGLEITEMKLTTKL